MKFPVSLTLIGLLLLSLVAPGYAKDYVDPDGAFALHIPDDWQSTRTAQGDNGWMTQFNSGTRQSETLSVITFRSEAALRPEMLVRMGKVFINGVTDILKTQNTIQTTEPVKVKFGAQEALRCEVTMQQAEKIEKGYFLTLLGQKNAILVIATAPPNDEAAMGRVNDIVTTLAVETRTPAKPGSQHVEIAPQDEPQPAASQTSTDIATVMSDMSGLVKYQSDLFAPPPILTPEGKTPTGQQAQAMFPAAETRYNAAAAGTLERADAARTAASLAGLIAWDAFDAKRTEEAGQWFARRADFNRAVYQARRVYFENLYAVNDAKLGALRPKVPVEAPASMERIVWEGLLDIKCQIASLTQNLARGANDPTAMLKWAQIQIDARQEQLPFKLADVKSGFSQENFVFMTRYELADAWDSLAEAQSALAQFADAEASYKQSLQIRRALPATYSPRRVDTPLRHLAWLHNSIGDLRAARDDNLQSLDEFNASAAARQADLDAETVPDLRILSQTNDLETVAVLFNNLGSIEMGLGDYKTALDYLQKALATVEPLPTDIHQISGRVRAHMRAVTLGNIATLHAETGELDQALREYDEVIKLWREIGDSESAATALQNAAGIYYERDNLAETTRYLQQARQLFAAAQYMPGVISTTGFLAVLTREANDLPKASALASEALTLARQSGTANWIGSAALTLASVRLAQNQLDEAGVMLEESARADERSGSPLDASATSGKQGELLEKRGDLNGALEKYQKSVALLESVRAGLTSQDGFSDLKNSYKAYDRIVRLLIKLNRPDEAFDYLGRAKSKQLQDKLRLANIKTPDPALQALLERYNGLETKLRSVSTQLESEQAKPETDRDAAKIENLRLVVATTKGEYRRVFEQIKATYPNWESNLTVKPKELSATQHSIPSGVVLVEYAPLGDQLYIFVVTKDSLKIVTPPAKPSEITEHIKAVRQLIINQAADSGRGAVLRTEGAPQTIGDATSLNDHLTELYDQLIAPIEADITAAKTVAFIPNQEFYYLPFQALAKKQGNGVRYLIEDKEVVYLTGADVMRFVQPPDAAKLRGGLLAFGNPVGANLPAALEEVKDIATIYPGTKILTGADATKSAILLPGVLNERVVHFATHGVLNSKVPADSYIQMAKGGAPGSEQLTVNEVWDLPLAKVDLVTLSACETALSQQNPDGGDITTLAEAFSTAGATTVVCSLWSVADESTKELMVEFYTELAAGASKAAALRGAELKVMKNPKYSHPFYWAPFILMGDWR